MPAPLPPQARRILFATLGSLGDLHPCLALGIELQRRGHQVTIAATPYYRARVEACGLQFHPIRPDWNPTDSALIAQCAELKRGPEILFRRIILPHLGDTYDDLLAAARNADLMIAGELVFAAPLVAEKLALPWVSAILSPCSFFSAHDPSVLVNVPSLIHLRKLGPRAYKAGLGLGRMATKNWWAPVRNLRRSQGLRPQCDPVFSDKFSPLLVLALFSHLLGKQQPDWPAQTLLSGFVFYDNEAETPLELTTFLAAGEAPIVFTQGSTAVHNAGDFYQVSVQASRRVNRRAVLLGSRPAPGQTSPDILALPYASYAQVFPHAAAIVHQGGSGTTGQGMRAGRPMLIVPYGWDQPDNAARAQRLGIALHLPRRQYSENTAAAALSRLLDDPSFQTKATAVAAEMMQEDALITACNAIESLLA